MEDKLHRIVKHGSNSIFYIDAKYVLNVFDLNNKKLKYLFNFNTKTLTVLGDYDNILVKHNYEK